MFDDRLKMLRCEKGLNMKQTAKKLDIPYTTYVGYEKNEREPNSETLIMLADFFNCSVDYLVGRNEARNVEEYDDTELLTEKEPEEKLMTLADRLKAARTDAGLSQKELAQMLDMNLRTYGSYERGERDISTAVLLNICTTLKISSDYLLGRNVEEHDDTEQLIEKYDNISPVSLKRFPMLGNIACGEPIFADEDRESFVMADEDIRADFCLTAKGDSMINARIYDGDIVFVRKQDEVENGEIAAVIIDDEATLKRVYYDREDNYLQLVAENPKYKPLVYRDEQLEQIRILGKAVYFMSAL